MLVLPLKMAPTEYEPEACASRRLGTPPMLATTEVGEHPPVLLYVTEKVKLVAVVPLPGDTIPFVRVTMPGLHDAAAWTSGAAGT